MKKFLSLITLMFLMVGVANASEFTDANKKVGEYVYTLGSYSYRAPAGVLTVEQAKAARAAFGVDILYFESEAGFLCYVDKDDIIGAASSPVNGTAIITSVLLMRSMCSCMTLSL
jgi:hypothetical protein